MSADLFYPGEVGVLRADLTHVLRQVAMGYSLERIVGSVESALAESDARIAARDAQADADFVAKIANLCGAALPVCAVPDAPEFMRNAPRSATGD